MVKKSRKKRISRPLLIIAAVVLLVLSTSIWYGYRIIQSRDSVGGETVTNPPGTEKIDLSPPTLEDKKAVDQHKEELGNQKPEPSDSDNTGEKKQITPIITSASKTEVRAYVSGIIEEGGTCTATATQGSQTISATGSGFDNVSYTQCAPISINLGSGTWSIVVSYSSPAAEGKSQAKVVD